MLEITPNMEKYMKSCKIWTCEGTKINFIKKIIPIITNLNQNGPNITLAMQYLMVNILENLSITTWKGDDEIISNTEKTLKIPTQKNFSQFSASPRSCWTKNMVTTGKFDMMQVCYPVSSYGILTYPKACKEMVPLSLANTGAKNWAGYMFWKGNTYGNGTKFCLITA